MEPYISFDDIRFQFAKNHNQFRPQSYIQHQQQQNDIQDDIQQEIDENNMDGEYIDQHIDSLSLEENDTEIIVLKETLEINSITSSTLIEHISPLVKINNRKSVSSHSLLRLEDDFNEIDINNNNNQPYHSNQDDNVDVYVNSTENNNNQVNDDNKDINSDDNHSSSGSNSSISEDDSETSASTTTSNKLIRDTTENDEEELKTLDEKVDEFVSLIIHEPHTGLTIYDNYGFLVDQDMVQIHLIYKDKFTRQEKLRKQQWLDFIESNAAAFHSLSLAKSPMAQATTTYRRESPPKPLKEMIRQGVPTDFRSSVWLRCSGAYLRLAANPDEYYNILKVYSGKQSVATKQIAMDIDRTFPDHKFLNTQEHMETLSRVLVAYSWRNPKVGYCQCMNFIVGYLLLHMSEHEAYWTLVSIIEDILPGEYYTSTMMDLSVDVRFVFDEILAKKLPKLHKHFTTLNLSLPLIMTQWFLCIMATATPTETTFRIWDVFFSEGSKVLFRFAIALFKINEEKLLTCKDYNTLYNLIRKLPSMMYDADQLIDVAFNKIGTLTMKSIDQKRKDSKIIVFNEYIEFQMMRNGIKKGEITHSPKHNGGNKSPTSRSPTSSKKKSHKEI